MTGSEFFNSSLPEIYAAIESMNRRRKYQIGTVFMQAEVIVNHLAVSMNGNETQRVMPWDYYPELFKEEKEQFEKQTEQKALEEYKERRRLAMDKFNAQFE